VLKLGLPDWVRRRGGRPLPAAGNPNLNLNKRPEVNKSGPDNSGQKFKEKNRQIHNSRTSNVF
jgi:hypothetical protein